MGLCGKSRVVLGGETLNDDEPEWAIKNVFGVVLMQQSLAQSLFLIAVGFLGSQSWGSAESLNLQYLVACIPNSYSRKSFRRPTLLQATTRQRKEFEKSAVRVIFTVLTSKIDVQVFV